MEEQLHLREEQCAELEGELAEVKRKGQREKEMLKRATKQHRSQAAQSEHTVETLGAQLEDVVSCTKDYPLSGAECGMGGRVIRTIIAPIITHK